MLSRIRRFSQIFQAAILSCVISALFVGVCYGQQQGNLTTVLISGRVGVPGMNNTQRFDGGDNSSVSADGRTVAYTANNLVKPAIFRDPTVTGGIGTVFSISPDSTLAVDGSATSINRDGTLITFVSSQLLPGGRNNVYLFSNNQNGVPRLISASINNNQLPANNESISPSISSNGRFIAFASRATDLISDPTNIQSGISNIYLFDSNNPSGLTLVTIRDIDGQPFRSDCSSPSVNDNGDIVFVSNGRILLKRNIQDNVITLDPSPGNTSPNISSNGMVVSYLSSQPISGTPTIIFFDQNGTPGTQIQHRGINAIAPPALSKNGRFLAVASGNDLLVPNDNNGFADIFLFDLSQGFANATLVSVDVNGASAIGTSTNPSINDDASVVAFTSFATLTPDPIPPGTSNVYARVNLAGGIIGGGVGTINLGPVCFPAGQGIAPNAIELTWGFPGVHNEQLRGFKVEINRKEGSQFKQIAKVPADGKANYIDTSLKANTRYEYRLWIEDPKGFAYSVDFAAKTQKKNKKNK